MTTAVASPPSFQSLPRLGWNNSASPSGLNSMSADDVSRMFMPQRKTVPRTNSSSSVSSTSSTSSTATTVQSSQNSSAVINGDSGSYAAKKKPRGGFWPTTKQDTPANGINGRTQNSSTASTTGGSTASPVAPSQPPSQVQQNAVRTAAGQASNEPTAVLALLPMNGTFERKQINVPFFPDVLRIGRQTNAKTVPTPSNGFFDSKVLSRQHAEVWAERNGKIWIRDVKSSNGTFVNGHRLSPENRDSEPQELHQHDTLELGIDIVSEDQKVIVHHKVSAKVEYVGIPGSSNNVLDLNFGDLDPSQNGSLLSSPISQPMVATRGRGGGSSLVNGRLSATSSIAGSQMNSLAQHRQMNFWSMPLNVEHLVKTLSTEMKAAKQQTQELDQTSTFLTSLLSSDSRDEKPSSPPLEIVHQRMTNGKIKAPRLESMSRFSDPPAPPPQQPLPEKPDVPRSSPTDASSHNLLKRSDTAKVGATFGGSPTNPHSSQILSLVEALSSARKELDSQAARVKHLEDLLNEERLAKERAEERARRLEENNSYRPVPKVEEVVGEAENDASAEAADTVKPRADLNGSAEPKTSPPSSEQDLQQKLDAIVAEMAEMKQEMERYQKRAEVAETDASSARSSLAEMITRLRQANAAEAEIAEKSLDSVLLPASPPGPASPEARESSSGSTTLSKYRSHAVNGHIRTPSRLPEQLERALATVIRDSNANGETLAYTAPYASMLGVVLLGVGLMAYLNSWQKVEK